MDCIELDMTEHIYIYMPARRSNQSSLNEINPEYSLEGLIVKLMLQQFGHLMQRADSLGKTLMWERLKEKKMGVAKNKVVISHHRFNGRGFEQTPRDSEGQRSLVCCSTGGHKVSDTT